MHLANDNYNKVGKLVEDYLLRSEEIRELCDITVEPLKTDTPRDRLKCPSWRGVRFREVLKSIDIRQKELKVQLIVVGYALTGYPWL